MKAAWEEDVVYLNDWLGDMADKVADAKLEAKNEVKAAKMAIKSAKKVAMDKVKLAQRRLEQIKDLKIRVGELRDNLADESQHRAALEKLSNIRLEIKRERQVGRRGGGSKWPLRIVLLICELLVAGAPPSSVPGIIKSNAAYYGAKVHGEVSVNYVRQCRVVVQNLNELLAAYRLGNAPRWIELFTDGTTRRQIAFQNLVIGLQNGDKFDQVIASSCIFLENETSDKQVEAVKEKAS